MSNEDFDGLRINKDYAEKYNRWREKEELQKLKDKYGDVEDESSSTSESEDEDAEALTVSVERDWLRTLAAIKNKDPKIYDPKVTFYDAEDAVASTSKQRDKSDKPMYLKDYERNVILEKGGIISDDDSDASDRDSQKWKCDPSYYEEQEQIKCSLIEAIGDSDEADDGDLFTPRKKDHKEEEKEEEEYMQWLKGQKQDLKPQDKVGLELDPLKKYWSKPDLGDGEKFLRDYILNKQYLDDDDENRIPTYAEIIQDEDLSEDERELEKEEEFERKYNFRFEEPDAEFIKSYPRTIGESVRRKKDKRIKKRAEIKERKKKEKEKKMEELKQLKNLKKREIHDKLNKIKEITGNPEVGFTEQDIQGDFDPNEHDRLMQEVFDDGYYMDADGQKPVFDDDEDLGLDNEDWDEWRGTASGPQGEPHAAGCDDDHYGEDDAANVKQNFNMDADDLDGVEDRSFGLDGKSKKKRKSKFARALERKKPVFDPEEKTFDEYFNEYYKLDYEDIVGDQPCRFKYRPVIQNDFGLETEEVLSCPDRELNAWVSLKKIIQYRTEEEEQFDHRLYSKKGKQLKRKLQILPSLDNERDDELLEDSMSQSITGSKKKRRKRKKSCKNDEHLTNQSPSLCEEEHVTLKKNNKHKGIDNSTGTDSVKRPKLSVETDKSKKVKLKPIEEPAKTSLKTFKKDSPVKHKKSKQVQESMHKGQQGSSPGGLLDKKKQKKKGVGLGSGGFHMSEERLKSYGIDPKKFKFTYMKKMHEDLKKSK